MTSKSVVLRNMFDPEKYISICWCVLYLIELSRETERDWDKDLTEEVRGECEDKYGQVEAIKVDKDSSQVCRISLPAESAYPTTDVRGKYSSSLTTSILQKKPSKA